jgi:site-specific DNA-methyltransferase (adenine-specific)
MATPPFYADDSATIYNCDAFELLPQLSQLDAIITDPPYSSGGTFKGGRSGTIKSKYVSGTTTSARPEFTGDNRDQRSFLIWSTWWMQEAFNAVRDEGHLLVFTDWRQLPTVTDAIQVAGWLWQGIQVWHKTTCRPRPNAFRADTEFIVWATKGPMTHNLENAIYLPGVTKAAPPQQRSHTTQKPVQVLEWLGSIVPAGSIICDPFMGSGSTLVAGRNLGHQVIGADVSKQFCTHAAGWLSDSDLAA